MPDFVKTPLRVLLVMAALYVTARFLLPSAVFDTLGLSALESTVWSTVAPFLATLAGYEAAVVVSAMFDWREAKLGTVGWGQAWAVAHVTVLVRGYRRSRWIATGLRATAGRLAARISAARDERLAERECVVLDPTAPFDGMVIEHDHDEDAA